MSSTDNTTCLGWQGDQPVCFPTSLVLQLCSTWSSSCHPANLTWVAGLCANLSTPGRSRREAQQDQQDLPAIGIC